MPHVTCIVCGKICHKKYKPVVVAAAFDGMGADRMRVALQGTDFDLGHTSGTVLCSASGRRCYSNLRDRLLDVGAYQMQHRQATVDEVSALRAIAGPAPLGAQVRRGVRENGGGESGWREASEAPVLPDEAAVQMPEEAAVGGVVPRPRPCRPFRKCGTPGCEQPDGHHGPCASMMAAPGSSRRTAWRVLSALGTVPARVAVEEDAQVERTRDPIDPDMLPQVPLTMALARAPARALVLTLALPL